MNLDKLAMNSYEKQSRKCDKAGHGQDPNLVAQRAVQDAVMAERHRGFDASAKDTHMKYERPQFAVVGEGTRSAQEAYDRNYVLINWAN